jgi:apolipoprotein N-acyltransferase
VLRLGLLALAALGLSQAFSPYALRFLAPLALVPLFWIIDTEKPARVFRYGLFFGSVFFLLHLWWLWTLVVPIAPITRVLLDIGCCLLFVYLGLWIALFALGTKLLGLYASPFIWAGLEWLRSQSEAGFPWGLLGTSLTPFPALIQFTSITGVYGASAFVVWLGLLVFKLITDKRRKLFGGLLLASLAVPLAYGAIRIKENFPWFKAGVVQPNVSPTEKGLVSEREANWRRMLRLAHEAVNSGGRVLVFPETSTLVPLDQPSWYRDSLQHLADSSGVLIITGTPLYRSYGYHNAAAVIQPVKPVTEYYYKIHLAPFSEHFPFVNKIPLLRRMMTQDMGDCQPGTEYEVFEIRGYNSRTQKWEENRFAVPICFEGIFPGLVREFTRRGANAIVVITNDGWFGKTPGPYQHCELMVMRAIENGVPLVRCANNGISLVADAYGRVRASTKLYVATSLVADVPRPLLNTFYRRYGDVFSYACLILIALLIPVRLVIALARRRKPAAG